MNNSVVIVPILLLLILSFNCGSDSEAKPGNTKEITSKVAGTPRFASAEKDSVTIAWDSPTEGTDSVDYYELFYQTIKDSGWTMIRREIKGTTATIYTTELDTADSVYNFAVRTVLKSGLKSDFDFSSDSTEAKGKWPLVVHRKK